MCARVQSDSQCMFTLLFLQLLGNSTATVHRHSDSCKQTMLQCTAARVKKECCLQDSARVVATSLIIMYLPSPGLWPDVHT